jgi:hypothetical protein
MVRNRRADGDDGGAREKPGTVVSGKHMERYHGSTASVKLLRRYHSNGAVRR